MKLRNSRELPIKGQIYAHVRNFSDSATNTHSINETVTSDPAKANVVTSMVENNVTKHKVILDIDLPAALLPSSTPGHSHLYIDHELSWRDYKKLMKVLAKVGIVEPGFVDASIHRGYSAVRLPWVKKTQEEMRISEMKRAAARAGEGPVSAY